MAAERTSVGGRCRAVLGAFVAFAAVEGVASGFQFLALILLVDALLVAVFALMHRVK